MGAIVLPEGTPLPDDHPLRRGPLVSFVKQPPSSEKNSTQPPEEPPSEADLKEEAEDRAYWVRRNRFGR